MFASSKFLFESFFSFAFFRSFLRYFHSGWIGSGCACVLRVAKRAKNPPLYREEYSNWHSPTHLWQMAWISTRGNELKFSSDFHQIGTNRKYRRVGADFLRGSWKTRRLGFFQTGRSRYIYIQLAGSTFEFFPYFLYEKNQSKSKDYPNVNFNGKFRDCLQKWKSMVQVYIYTGFLKKIFSAVTILQFYEHRSYYL